MSRKELVKVYDQMRPGEEQKAEMFRNILKMSSEDTDKETDRTKVILYKEKRGISVSGICKAAAAATCAGLMIFGGIHFIQKNAEQTEKLANNDISSENETEMLSDDTVLTDSKKRYRAELIELPDEEDALGVYNGNIIYARAYAKYSCSWSQTADMTKEEPFKDADGNVIEDIMDVVSGEKYIYVNQNYETIYVFDYDMVNISVISGYSFSNVTAGNDGTFYFFDDYKEIIFKCDLNGNILSQTDPEIVVTDDSNYLDIYDLYRMESGNLAAGVRDSSADTSRFFILDPDLNMISDISVGISENIGYYNILSGYEGAMIVLCHDYDLSESVLYFFDLDKMDYYVMSKYEKSAVYLKGCGEYSWMELIDGRLKGYNFKTDTITDISSVPQMNDSDRLFFFSNSKGICAAKLVYEFTKEYYSYSPESTESKKICSIDLGLSYDIMITEDGHIRAYDTNFTEGYYTVADIDIETGEYVLKNIPYGPDTEVQECSIAYYTDNYFCVNTPHVEVREDESGEQYVLYPAVNTVYSNDGTAVYTIPDGGCSMIPLRKKDVLAYVDIDDKAWEILDLKTGNKTVMKNDIPSDWRIWPGNGKYDFFFASEKGIYGGIIDGDEFRYCVIVDFSRLEIPDSIHSDIIGLDEPITTDNICKFFYDDDDNIYIATKGGCDLMKLIEN